MLPCPIASHGSDISQHNPTYILFQTTLTRHPSGGPNAYLQYVRHITSQPPPGSNNPEYTSGYADYLQAPLQPLMDDLGSATYDVFERDAVKYRQYEEVSGVSKFQPSRLRSGSGDLSGFIRPPCFTISVRPIISIYDRGLTEFSQCHHCRRCWQRSPHILRITSTDTVKSPRTGLRH